MISPSWSFETTPAAWGIPAPVFGESGESPDIEPAKNAGKIVELNVASFPASHGCWTGKKKRVTNGFASEDFAKRLANQRLSFSPASHSK